MDLVVVIPFPRLLAFLFGAAIGSFLNVVIARLPDNKSLAFPGSHCPKCEKEIRWYDNIPILSYLLLRGKCRNCALPISLRYPMVELLTAVCFAAVIHQFGITIVTLQALVFVSLLIALTFIDLSTWLLPDVLTLGGIVAALTLRAFQGWEVLQDGLIGMVVGGGFLWLVAVVFSWVLKKDAMGGGDIKLLAMLGAFLGMMSVPFVIFLASMQGSVVGIFAVTFNKQLGAEVEEEDFKPTLRHVPFGPFLALGGLQYLFFAPVIFQGWVAWSQWLGKWMN